MLNLSNSSEDRSDYGMSFTVGGLLANESLIAIEQFINTPHWKTVREKIINENLYHTSSRASAVRISAEVIRRLSSLDEDEIKLMSVVSPSEFNNLLWIAICRHYTFIGDFAKEVLRDRYLLRQRSLNYQDFDDFVVSKTLWHPELVDTKDSTLKKCRAVLFRILRETGLLRGEIIEPALITDRIRNLIESKNPNEIKFFPVFN